MGLFDGIFATPGGGIFGGRLNDPNGALPPDSPQLWGAPGGYGLADMSTGDRPISAYAQGKLGGFQGMPALLGFNPWFPVSTSANPATDLLSQASSAPVAGLQSPSAAVNPAAAVPSPGAVLAGNAASNDASSNGFLSRLGQALHDNSSMLMAMGGGMMTGGLGKGFQAGAAAADEATSKRQAPQTVKVRQPGGGEMLMMWDPGQRRYVPAPVTGLAQSASGGASAPAGYAEGMTATNPQTGQRITFRNGQWQTM